MTATRIVKVATLAVGGVFWLLAGAVLWRTKVPADLHLPSLDEHAIFGARLVHRAQRYELFLDLDWLLGTIAGLAVLIWMVRRGPRLARSLGLGRVNAGIVAGAVTLTVSSPRTTRSWLPTRQWSARLETASQHSFGNGP